MTLRPAQLAWIDANWMYAGLAAGLFLIAVAPVALPGASIALALVYLQLPAYMLHQVEEHADDRFRRFFNATIGHGIEVLSTRAVVVINVPVVWGLYLASLYLARFVSMGLGLIGTYAMLINAMTHIGAGVIKREANPGIWTAGFVFLPLSLMSIVAIQFEGANLGDHLLALAIGAGIHGAIIAHVRRHRATLTVAPA